MLMGKGSEIKKPQITQDGGSHLKKKHYLCNLKKHQYGHNRSFEPTFVGSIV